MTYATATECPSTGALQLVRLNPFEVTTTVSCCPKACGGSGKAFTADTRPGESPELEHISGTGKSDCSKTVAICVSSSAAESDRLSALVRPAV